MNSTTKIRWVVVTLFIVTQVVQVRSLTSLPFFPDLLFLIIAFTALKTDFFKSYLIASLLGWLTDYLSGGIVGVFGFSRVISAAILHEMVKIVDLKRKGFTFFLVLISLSLSNFISFLFFYLIGHAHLSVSLLVWQPLSTASLALVLLYWKSINKMWDVY